ncbi:MAG: Na+/H+ antiporter NhaA [Actinomycetota bacterium]
MTPDSTSPKINGERPARLLRDFLRAESAGAVLLAVGALVALIWANSPWSASYRDLWSSYPPVSLSGLGLDFDLRHWINDGAMTLFFFVVGLEIKRELTVGHLSSLRTAALPAIAAFGGMLVPAILYLSIAGSTEPTGWAIPVATDIALAVGALSVAGSRLPPWFRAFLLALAIVDDIGAIVIIAVVYSSGIKIWWLVAGASSVLVTLALQKLGAKSPIFYLVVGAWMWLAFYKAGIHPTIAGVVMGLLTPSILRHGKSLIDSLQHTLHPWSTFGVVPVFALANSGVEVSMTGLQDAFGSPITWGIVVGLLVGKPLGIVVATRLTVRAGVANLPAEGGRQLVGTGMAAGIGFTVAIFITELALTESTDQANAKLAILVASILSAVLSIVLLTRGSSKSVEID